MAKTRSKPGNPTTATTKTKITLKTLDAPVENAPQLVILPKDASPNARIVTINNSRYFICPENGFYEFTRISAPKSTPRSWLLSSPSEEEVEEEQQQGYILPSPSLLLATPIDPLFLLLPSLSSSITSSSTEYLAPSDYLDKFSQSSPHLSQILHTGTLPQILTNRIEAVSDCMDLYGDGENMCAISLEKLVGEIVRKARRMVVRGLPRSLEEKFVKEGLDVPVLSIKREDSSSSSMKEEAVEETDGHSQPSTKEEADSQASSTASVDTAATSIPAFSQQEEEKEEEEAKEKEKITHLLRLRTSLSYLQKSYIPASLSLLVEPFIAKTIDWSPLTIHLERISSLKKEAQALRSIGENFSRKRGALGEEDDEDGREEVKKRKKEEEEKRKRNVSQGVRKLAKADRSGMRSLSSFFGKK